MRVCAATKSDLPRTVDAAAAPETVLTPRGIGPHRPSTPQQADLVGSGTVTAALVNRPHAAIAGDAAAIVDASSLAIDSWLGTQKPPPVSLAKSSRIGVIQNTSVG